MTAITDIIDIQISRETTAVSRAAFNIPMFLAEHSNFTERARSYTNITSVADDFGSNSNVYEAASKFFGQDIRPPQIVIGRKAVSTVDVSVNTVEGTVTNFYNGTEVVTDIDAAADATAAVALIEADFTAATIDGISFTDNLDGTYTIEDDGVATEFSFYTTSDSQSVNYTSSESWVDALDAVSEVNNEWYALVAETREDADILNIASAVEARKKIYGTASSDSDILDAAVTDDIGSQLFDLGYARTFIMYHQDATTTYPEAAWIGGQLPEQPGSNTWKFKTLNGISVSNLSSTQSNAAKDKNVNTYERVGGVGITSEGMMAVAEFIDVKNNSVLAA